MLDSGQFVLGDEVAAFESEFAAYCGARHAIAVNSGTSALHLALLAAGIGPGDEVITGPHTFVATVAAIVYAGARPVFVDIDPLTFTIDPARIEPAITAADQGRSFRSTCTASRPTWTPSRRSPAATAWWSSRMPPRRTAPSTRGVASAALGDLGCFSFYPGKNLAPTARAARSSPTTPSSPRHPHAARLGQRSGNTTTS